MKIMVGVKRVIDHNIRIRVKSDFSGIDFSNMKMSMNPFCEIALEEAVRLKEKKIANEVVAISVGCDRSQEQLRFALAQGADRAILVKHDAQIGSLNIAKIFKKLSEIEKPDLILLGKQSIDTDHNQTGQMLAAISNFASATFASKIEIQENKAFVTREVDGGLQTISISLPAIITADLRLNTPRFASLPNIMKAKSKNIDEIDYDSLNISTTSSTLEILKVEPTPKRKPGIMLNNVDELIDKLKNEAKVL